MSTTQIAQGAAVSGALRVRDERTGLVGAGLVGQGRYGNGVGGGVPAGRRDDLTGRRSADRRFPRIAPTTKHLPGSALPPLPREATS